MSAPSASLNPLRFPDGAASYISPSGAQILASVNGPLDFHRRDSQRSDEAAVEVVVKPSAGLSGVGEHNAESTIRHMLSRVILKKERAMARGGLVITLAVVRNEILDGKVSERGFSPLPVLPSLLNAALLALLTAAVPLSMTYTAVLIAVLPDGNLLRNPARKEIANAPSLHVFSISSTGSLLLSIDEGSFDLETYDRAYVLARQGCLPLKVNEGGDVNMKQGATAEPLEMFVRHTVEDRLRDELTWKVVAP
ncbi:exosome non-catalytic core subunit rrp46 [Ascosphaera atra]|nr:exosome non-catalytic core subunit rrp46 [Ascosphaera atra]